MDAALYFRLTDRIREANSMAELETLAPEIERAEAHDFERRALRTLVARRQALLGAHVRVGSRSVGAMRES